VRANIADTQHSLDLRIVHPITQCVLHAVAMLSITVVVRCERYSDYEHQALRNLIANSELLYTQH